MTWVDLREGLTDEGLDRLAWGITGTKSGKPVSRPSRRPLKLGWSWGIVLSLLGVLLTVAAWLWPRSPDTPPPPSRPPMYAVRVRVLGPKGQPVAGSKIRVSTGDAPQSTPDDGWQIDIPAIKVPTGGEITLWAEHQDWGGNSKVLRLGTDQNVQVEIRLKEPESWLRGQVVDGNGHGLANVPVSIQEGPPGDATTGPKGRFEIKLPVPPETQVRLHAEHEGLSADQFCYAGRDTCSLVLEKP